VRVDEVWLHVHVVGRDGAVHRRHGVWRECDDAVDGKIDGAVVPECGVAARALPAAWGVSS
jgi:hypothetical protein